MILGTMINPTPFFLTHLSVVALSTYLFSHLLKRRFAISLAGFGLAAGVSFFWARSATTLWLPWKGLFVDPVFSVAAFRDMEDFAGILLFWVLPIGVSFGIASYRIRRPTETRQFTIKKWLVVCALLALILSYVVVQN